MREHHPQPEDRRPQGRSHRHGHGLHRHGRRPFDYGALRLVVLSMIAERPRHGYELMKAIEEAMGGGYSPSPGVIYPTLAWLEDMGYAVAEPEGGRRSYRPTPEGEAFLSANREALAGIAGRMAGPGHRREAPAPVLEAMHALKRALRARFVAGPPGEAEIARIAAAIATATRDVETDMSDPAAIVRSTATVETAKAAEYLAQLCKHFAHRVPASFEGNAGRIAFTAGTCRLHAEEGRLVMTAEAADVEALAEVEDVVARHLVRFAFREDLAVEWRPAT